MSAFTLKKFESPNDLAEQFALELVGKIGESEQLHVALSGGSTPKLLFQILAQQYAENTDWSKLHLYWGDERCVAPDHADSNFKMTRELLLDQIAIPEQNIHRIRGEEDPHGEAIRYAEVLATNLALKNDLPYFDLIILGMGGDGHTASIFPHQMELIVETAYCDIAEHPESGQQRVSLTGPVINNAKEVVFLITGAGKRAVFTEILHHTGAWESYPTSHINPQGELLFYVDKTVLEEL